MEFVSTVATNTSRLNSTKNNELEFWIFTGFSVPLALGALYLCVTQVIFCIKKANLTLKSKKKHRNSDEAAREKYGTILNIMSAFGTLCAFLRAGVDFRLTFGRYNDLGCDLAVKFKIANYALALVSIYLVLWLRQRVFYEHPGLRHLSSKLIRFVSWVMSIVIVIGIVGTSAVFFALGKYYGTPQGCAVPTGPLLIVRWVIMMTCTTFFQICLLTLFMYPLVKHRSMTRSKTNADEYGRNTIIPLIRRATVTSLSCVLSDIGFAFLVIGMKRETTTLTTFVYDINVVFNAFCMVMSFGNWRTRLMPWRVHDGFTSNETNLSSQDHSTQGTERTTQTQAMNSTGYASRP